MSQDAPEPTQDEGRARQMQRAGARLREWSRMHASLPPEARGLGLIVIGAIVVVVPVGFTLGAPGFWGSIVFLTVSLVVMAVVTIRTRPPSEGATVLVPTNPPARATRIFANVGEVITHMDSCIEEQLRQRGEVKIDNFGLDLEVVKPWLNYNVLAKRSLRNISYRGLILDPHAPRVRELIDGESNIRTGTIGIVLEEMRRLVREPELQLREVQVGLRSYADPPALHGFLINDAHLYLGFTEVVNGKLKGGNFPYRYFQFDGNAPLTSHYFRLFKTWFQHHWSNGSDPLRTAEVVPEEVLVIGHRGAMAHAPENTVASVAKAVELGCTWVEVDLQVTRDGAVVAMHDKLVDRTTDGRGYLRDLTLEEVRRLRTVPGGEPVPTLEELAAAVAGTPARLMLEIVSFERARLIVDRIRGCLEGEDYVVASFHHGVLREIKHEHPTVRTAALLEAVPVDLDAVLSDTRCDLLALAFDSIDQDLVRAAQQRDAGVLVWTVDDAREIDRALDLGVAGVVSNRPERVRERIEARRSRVPSG